MKTWELKFSIMYQNNQWEVTQKSMENGRPSYTPVAGFDAESEAETYVSERGGVLING